MILGGIVLQGTLLSLVIFFNNRGDFVSKSILGSLISVFTLMLFSEFIGFLSYIQASDSFFLLDLFLAPLTFLYVKSITSIRRLSKMYIGVHLGLPFLCNASFLVYHFWVDQDQHLIYNPELSGLYLSLVYTKIGFQIVYQAASISILFIALRNHKIKPYKPAVFKLIRQVLVILSTVFVLLPVVIVFEDIYRTELIDSDTVTNVIMIFSIYSIGYIALKNPLVYTREAAFDSNGKIENGALIKAKLSDEVLRKHVSKLQELMESKRLYTKPDLSLEDLANDMSSNRHVLSQVLNEGLGKSFSDFVNSYRLKDFEERITSDEHKHINILAIGLEAGFNSKATLYRAFKKKYGVAPKEFLRNMK